ncbi:MAG: hypothetical protein AVDCRST_MAG42-2066 [uncultured Chthoniobacterales bacterium]|uniref:Uncharacterized protein n=1 Tax=uncultured Chthoniobacterales bacterium TaxID=1836801 RepID=A0A6J4IB67_9BACT|nr:MAG: hypothetical protein AVDCRST_MAG42-2066 [uncultured Chthoniobacterales bacterium]
MRAIIPLLLAPLVISLSSAVAQTPVVVQPATPAAAPGAAATAPAASSAAALQLLQAMKAVNQETLTKQAATLQQLDELQKAADQIKILGKRG